MTQRTRDPYPVQFGVEYPEGPRNRLSVFLRLVLAIPIQVVTLLLELVSVSLGLIFFPTILMILFRVRYPKWWFEHNLEILRFLTRVRAYTNLLRDEYPSTDERQSVRLDITYSEAGHLNRFLPLVKWLLAIPHYIVLILWPVSFVVALIAWLAILFFGRHPRGLFDLSVGIIRWRVRVVSYALMLCTDRYPPFRLGE